MSDIISDSMQGSDDDVKRRTRVTPAQLSILEETFLSSATPNSKLRKQLAFQLQMPERSVQIWFQNRRAKVKMLQKRQLLRQEQDAARARLSSHPYWLPKLPIQRGWSTDIIEPDFPKRLESEPIHSFLPMHIGNLLATSITVGSWHRMKINQQDLTCYYSLNDRAFYWHIRDNSYHFKMMVSFDIIASIELCVLDDQISAQIDMDLVQPPIFFMETNNTWVQCSDFTEGMQASLVLHHVVLGLANDLRQELLSIASQDERLCQITRFPPMIHPHWRPQSVPLTTKDIWVPKPYPM